MSLIICWWAIHEFRRSLVIANCWLMRWSVSSKVAQRTLPVSTCPHAIQLQLCCIQCESQLQMSDVRCFFFVSVSCPALCHPGKSWHKILVLFVNQQFHLATLANFIWRIVPHPKPEAQAAAATPVSKWQLAVVHMSSAVCLCLQLHVISVANYVAQPPVSKTAIVWE